MHPESRKFLRFMVRGKVYQFKVLCFGLSTPPEVFTRVMAPVSAILHRTGVRLHRYLDDWLIQASSREQVLLALETVLQLCKSLGIVVNWEKSQLIPTQRIVYLEVILDSISFRASPALKRVAKLLQLCKSLGIVVNWEKSQLIPTQRIVYLEVILDSISFRASPALKRVDKLLSIGDVFLSCARQSVSSWLELLGVLSSIIQLVPGGRLRRRSFQFILRRHWDHVAQSVLVGWTSEIRQDLDWWLDRERLDRGMSLEQVSPWLDLWSDVSDVCFGAHLGEEVASDL